MGDNLNSCSVVPVTWNKTKYHVGKELMIHVVQETKTKTGIRCSFQGLLPKDLTFH